MEILYSDCNWLVVNKPTHLSTHGAWAGDLALLEWLELYHTKPLHVCSRLDKGTSGVIIFAKNAESSGRAQAIHEDQQAVKTYYFLTHQDPRQKGLPASWMVTLPVEQKPSRTEFFFEKKMGRYYLCRAVIYSGKKHQIRRHAQSCGLPILGDSEYHGAPYPRLCLHCYTVDWPEISVVLQAPLPLSFTTQDSLLPAELFVSCERRLHFYSNVTTAFRCVQRNEIPGCDFSVDFFSGWLCVDYYEAFTSVDLIVKNISSYLSFLMNYYQAQGWVLKTHNKDPHRRGLIHDHLFYEAEPPALVEVKEHGLHYQLDLKTSQHVGLFLDQRDNRKRIMQMASDKVVANLFAYTCSFSLCAAQARAARIYSIDIAKKYLTQGKNHFVANQLSLENCHFIPEDACKWVKKMSHKHPQSFDIIICDPPTYATVEGRSFHVYDAWEHLALSTATMLKPNQQSRAFFSCNHRAEQLSFYQQILRCYFASVIELSPPLDFPETSKTTQPLKLFLCDSPLIGTDRVAGSIVDT